MSSQIQGQINVQDIDSGTTAWAKIHGKIVSLYVQGKELLRCEVSSVASGFAKAVSFMAPQADFTYMKMTAALTSKQLIIPNYVGELLFSAAAKLTAAKIILPSIAVHGQRTTLATVKSLSGFTMSAAGLTINNPAVGLSSGSAMTYRFYKPGTANGQWFKSM